MKKLHISSTPPPRFLTISVVIFAVLFSITGCSVDYGSSSAKNDTILPTEAMTEDVPITKISFSNDDEFWTYAETKYSVTPIEEIRSGEKKRETLLVDALFLGVKEESSITQKYYIGYKLMDGTYQCFSTNFMPTVNDLMTSFSVMESLKQGDIIRICVRIPNGNYIDFDSLYGLKIIGHDEEAVKIALNISDNPLMNLKLEENNVMNGDNTFSIGKWALYRMEKTDMQEITQEQYKEFVESKVKGSEYKWCSIFFTDGTGIQWAGSLSSYGTYGEMDLDGCVTKPIGNIELIDQTYEYIPVS